ncbi:sensor domain-containing diguanylate cyclase [Caproiciproducens galactitolivorans]|uniref:Sensor domain-containing diguanylate cyclase n=1 Tax=Caproiciproducens galactitolivorans TaxID=642589 RepID=A0ABT4BU74_9FIRM|nr:sensor domain-containing diguanylate cyclase [Caproiciproducens galactitolivorans]MCY1713875.1 sensor domain-containing diguanylate cyclase [Caproiciproducens galactitolivorans]
MSQKAAEEFDLRRIINYLGAGILCCKNDDALTIVYASSPFYEMLGFREGEITALNSSEHPVLSADQRYNRPNFMQSFFPGDYSNHVEIELKLIKKDGHHIWVSCSLRLLIEEDGSELLCGVIEDITEKRRSLNKEREQFEIIRKAKRELAASEERYRIIMEQAADPILDYNFKTQEIYYSHPFQDRFGTGFSTDGLLDGLCHSDIVFAEDKQRLVDDLYGFMHGRRQKNPDYRFMDVNGTYRWYRVRSTIIRDEKGDLSRMIVFFIDIDNQKKETLRLRERAERDLLSGLYNHVTTSRLIDKAIDESVPGSQHALFLIDIDNFKDINDHLGHLLGDEVIGEVSAKLRSQFRENDIVGRIGGDEFVVFLKNISMRDIQRKAELLQNVFRSIRPEQNRDFQVSGSIGVSVYPKHGRDYHELFEKADAAMYAVKHNGKNSCCIYSDIVQ